MIFKDYYKILGLNNSKVSLDEIKAAYREQAKKYHPDVNVGNKFSEERIKDINEAYRILSESTSKRKYDRIWNRNVTTKRTSYSYSTKNDFFTMFFGINVYAEGYGVFVNNFEFDDDNLVVPCGEGTATFEPSTNTLTLNNATITESHDGYALIGNESEGVLNVVVIGTNYFDARDTGYDGFDLIGGGINITGTGTITMDGVMWGTYADQDVSVSISGITLNINSTDQAITSGNGITISNATININIIAININIIAIMLIPPY